MATTPKRKTSPKPPVSGSPHSRQAIARQDPMTTGQDAQVVTLEEIEAELIVLDEALKTMTRPLMKLDDTLQGSVLRLGVLLERLRQSLGSTPPRGARSKMITGHLTKTLKDLAKAGVDSITFSPNADETVTVQIQGGKEFVLPQLLGHLMRILARPHKGVSHDHLIPWRPKKVVLEGLVQHMGREVTSQALNMSICRLRHHVFHRGKSNPWLIEVDRRFGYRFALRRDATPPGIAMK